MACKKIRSLVNLRLLSLTNHQPYFLSSLRHSSSDHLLLLTSKPCPQHQKHFSYFYSILSSLPHSFSSGRLKRNKGWSIRFLQERWHRQMTKLCGLKGPQFASFNLMFSITTEPYQDPNSIMALKHIQKMPHCSAPCGLDEVVIVDQSERFELCTQEHLGSLRQPLSEWLNSQRRYSILKDRVAERKYCKADWYDGWAESTHFCLKVEHVRLQNNRENMLTHCWLACWVTDANMSALCSLLNATRVWSLTLI